MIGGLVKMLGRGYRIERIVMLQIENCGGPKLYYVVLSGPRGGKVVCDPLNIGDILSRKFNIPHGAAIQALVNYGVKTNKIDLIQASYWEAYNDRTGLKVARHEDKNIQQKLLGRVYKASDLEYFKLKVYNSFYIEPNWTSM